jgi:hypothetical protein
MSIIKVPSCVYQISVLLSSSFARYGTPREGKAPHIMHQG